VATLAPEPVQQEQVDELMEMIADQIRLEEEEKLQQKLRALDSI